MTAISTTITHEALVQTLDRFLHETREQDTTDKPFGYESARVLRIDVNGGVWLKPGAAIAHRGDLAFERRPTLGAGSVEDAILRETAPLVRASGTGRLYCGSGATIVRIVRLAGESVMVAWPHLLAFEDSLEFEPGLAGHGVGIAAGGLVAIRLSGRGDVALSTHGQPVTLNVTPGRPVYTDPHATIAWSADLEPTVKTNLSWRSAFGHGGREPIEMAFAGTGFVVVQPYEDPSRIQLMRQPLQKVAKLVTA